MENPWKNIADDEVFFVGMAGQDPVSMASMERDECAQALGGTFQKEFYRDQQGNEHQYDAASGQSEEDWLKEQQQFGIQLTKAGENERPSNYIYTHKMYDLGDGQQVYVREDEEEEFQKQAQKNGWAPKALTSRRWNGVEVTGDAEQLLNLQQNFSQDGHFDDATMVAFGASEEQILKGRQIQQELVQKVDEQVKARGKMDFFESEANRSTMMSGRKPDSSADQIDTYAQMLANAVSFDLAFTSEEILEKYGNTDAEDKIKNMGWFDSARLFINRLAPGGESIEDIWKSDEEVAKDFKKRRETQLLAERIAAIRGQTFGAQVGSGTIDIAAMAIDMATTGLAAAAITGTTAGIGTIALGAAIYGAGHAADEYGRQTSERVWFNPLTGRMEKAADGREGLEAIAYTAGNIASNYAIEKVGGKVVGGALKFAAKPITKFTSKLISKEMSTVLGMAPGVVKNWSVGGPLKMKALKVGRAYHALTHNAWGKVVQSGIRGASPSGFFEEMNEELLQAALEGGLNLSGEADIVTGEIAKGSWSAAGEGMLEVLKSAPQFATTLLLYNVGAGPVSRGLNTAVNAYGTRATLANALKWSGEYTAEEVRAMTRDEIRDNFKRLYMTGDPAVREKITNEFLKKHDTAEGMLGELQNHEIADFEAKADKDGEYTVTDKTDGKTYVGNDAVRTWAANKLGDYASAFGEMVLRTEEQQAKISRAIMFVSKTDIENVVRQLQETGATSAFETLGNSAELVDSMQQAMALRQLSEYSAYHNTPMQHLLRAQSDSIMRSVMADSRNPNAEAMGEFYAYLNGISIDSISVGKGDIKPVFKAEDFKSAKVSGINSLYVEHDNIRITKQKRGSDVGDGARDYAHNDLWYVQLSAPGKKNFSKAFASEAEAISYANELAAKNRKSLERHQSMKFQAEQVYDKLFGNKDGGTRRMVVLANPWEDRDILSSISGTLQKNGVSESEIPGELANIPGLTLDDGTMVVFTDNCPSLTMLTATIRHEGFHSGLKGLYDLSTEKGQKQFIAHARRIFTLSQKQFTLRDALGKPLTPEAFSKMSLRERANVLNETCAYLCEVMATKPGMSDKITTALAKMFGASVGWGNLSARQRESEARAIISAAFAKVHDPAKALASGRARAEKGKNLFALPPAMSDAAFRENERQRDAENQAAWGAYADQANESVGGDVDFSGTGRGARRQTNRSERAEYRRDEPRGDYKRRRDEASYSTSTQMGDYIEGQRDEQDERRAWEERRAEKDVRDSEARADSHAVTRYEEAVDKARQTDRMYRDDRANQRAEGEQARAALNKDADDSQAAEKEYSRDLLEDAVRQSPRTSASASEYVEEHESQTNKPAKKSKKERRAERRAKKEKAKNKKAQRDDQGKSGFVKQTRRNMALDEEASDQLEQDALGYIDDTQASLGEESYYEEQARLQEEADAAWSEWLDDKEAKEASEALGSYLSDPNAKAQEDADWNARKSETAQEAPSKVRADAHFETQFAQLLEQDEQEEELYRNRKRERENEWARHDGDAPVSEDASKDAGRRRRDDLEREKSSRQKLQRVVDEEPKPVCEAVLWRELQEANDLHNELTGGIEDGKPLHPAHRKALDEVNGQIVFLTQLADALESAQPSENAQQKKDAIEALREKAGAPEASAIVPPVQQEEAVVEEDVVEDEEAPVPQETKTEPVAETPVDAPVAETPQQEEQSSPEPTLEQTIQEVVTEAEESVIDLAEVREEIRKEYDTIKELWDDAASADEKIRAKIPTRIGKLSATDTFNLVLDAYISQKYGTSLLTGPELASILSRAGNIGDVQEAIDWLVGAWQKSPDKKIRNAFAEMEPLKYKKQEAAAKSALIAQVMDELGELVSIKDRQGLAAKMENITEAQKTRAGSFVRQFGIQLPGLSASESAELVDHIDIATNNTLNRSDAGYGTVIKNTEALLDKLLSALEKKLPGWKIVEKAKEGYVLPEKIANALVALNHEGVRKYLGSATTRSDATQLLRKWMPYFPKDLLEVVPVEGNKKGLKAPKGRYILEGFYFGEKNTYSAPIDIEMEEGEDGRVKKKAKYTIRDTALVLSKLVEKGDVRPISTLKAAIDADVAMHAEAFKSLVKETPDGKTLGKTARQYVYDTIDAINKLRSIGFEGNPGILSGEKPIDENNISKTRLPPKEKSTVNVYKKGKGAGGASFTVTGDDVEVSFKMASPVERRRDLIGLHNITPEKLIGAGVFRGFAMPSIAIVKDTMGHNKFGDITLIMRKDAFDPEKNEKNVISSRDIYSPIFPTKEELDKLRARKGRNITLQDIVDLMDRGLRRGISGAAGATIAKDFASLKDVIKFEKLLKEVTPEESKEAFRRFDALVDKIVERTGDIDITETGLADHFEKAKGDVKAIAERLLKDEFVTTKKEATAIARELKAISELPTRYFEGKLYRPVLFDEVAAAVVPCSYVMTQPEVLDTLDAYEIETYFYTDKDAQSRLESVNDAADVADVKFKIADVNKKLGKLLGVRNTSAEGLLKALDQGGFAAPSIAVVKEDYLHDEFGDVTVIFGPKTFGPEYNAHNKLYTRDAWTPSTPSPKLVFSPDKFEDLLRDLDWNASRLIGDEYSEAARELLNETTDSQISKADESGDANALAIVKPILLESTLNKTAFAASYTPLRKSRGEIGVGALFNLIPGAKEEELSFLQKEDSETGEIKPSEYAWDFLDYLSYIPEVVNFLEDRWTSIHDEARRALSRHFLYYMAATPELRDMLPFPFPTSKKTLDQFVDDGWELPEGVPSGFLDGLAYVVAHMRIDELRNDKPSKANVKKMGDAVSMYLDRMFLRRDGLKLSDTEAGLSMWSDNAIHRVIERVYPETADELFSLMDQHLRGSGREISQPAKRLYSLQEVKKNRHIFGAKDAASHHEGDRQYERQMDRAERLVSETLKEPTEASYLRILDAIYESGGDMGKLKDILFGRKFWDGKVPPPGTPSLVLQAIENASTAKTDYMEAKPWRVVKPEEILAVVIPSEGSHSDLFREDYGDSVWEELSEVLELLNIPVYHYNGYEDKFLNEDRSGRDGKRDPSWLEAINDAADDVGAKFKISPAQLKMFGAETMANYNERIHNLRMQFPDFAQAAYDKIINYQGPLFRAYRKIAKGKQIADSENVEAAAKNVHGKIRVKSEEVHRKYIQPLFDTIKKHDLDVEKLDDYLYAKFAPERNLMIALRTVVVNAETGELETMKEDGSGMSSEEAAALMSKLASDPKRKAYEEAMRLVWKMNAESARRMVQYGFVRESQRDIWAKQSPHYVPLKNLDTVRFILRRSTGRKTRAASPLAGSIWQAQTVIRSGEISEVNKTLARFVQKYDPDGKQMGGRVLSHSGERKGVLKGEPVFVPYGSEAERDLRKAGIKLVETEDSKALGGAFVAQSSLYDKVGDKLVPNKLGVKVFTTKASAPNAATFFENGVRRFVVFDKENKEAMEIAGAINRAKLLTPNDSEAMRGAWNLAQRLLRWKADISTTLNPRFILRNMGADFFNTSMILMTEGKWKELGGFAKNYLRSMKAVRDFAKGKDVSDTEIGRYYLEARKNGMLTGVFGEGSFKEASHKLGRDISRLQGGPIRKTWEAFKDFMETIGSYPEQGARLSAYIAMRKSGMSPAQAAQYGREVSVDFNAKGELTPIINALYMFSNAGAQGIARAFTALKTGAEARGGGAQGYARAAIPAISTSIILGFISSMMMDAVGDDEDDEDGAIGSLNDRLPDYVKAQNINIPLGGDTYLQLPTRGSFQPFIHFGSLFYDFTQGKRDAGEVVAGFTESLRDSVDFIGGNSPTLGQWLTPTIFDPMVQILEGKDWTGKDLYRHDFGQKAPQSSLGKSGTSSLYKWMAEQLSRKTGGDDVEGGLVDMHPETYKLLTEFFAGSLGTMVGDVTATVGATMGGEFNVKNVPVVGGIARQAPGRESQYYAAYSEFDDVSKTYEAYMKASREARDDATRAKNREAAEAMRVEHPWLRSAKGLRKMGKSISDLRSRLANEKSPSGRKAIEKDIKGKERYFIKQITQSK